MTETSSAQPSLSTMRLVELQQLATSMGLKGISRMRKSELVAAIRDGGASTNTPPANTPARNDDPAAIPPETPKTLEACLLYTSDAADEL